jgi:hypothetical protein
MQLYTEVAQEEAKATCIGCEVFEVLGTRREVEAAFAMHIETTGHKIEVTHTVVYVYGRDDG